MTNEICFSDANSRETYFSIHHIRRAHGRSTGKGVKVGIIDWLFGARENKALYAGLADLSGSPALLFDHSGHGLWMATTLREIAPDCEIYALNAVLYDENGEKDRLSLFERAIEWAISNKLNVLTYSHAAFSESDKSKANDAVKKAVESGVITSFIHNDSEHNIWPYGCMPYHANPRFLREPDVNIFHLDYNTILLPIYEKYRDAVKAGEPIRSGDMVPFFSFSSMAVVLGGFVAIIKQLRPDFNAEQTKELLIETSYPIRFKGKSWYDLNPCERAVDIGRAVEAL